MADLFQCTLCNSPFVAEDEELIARRRGSCPECAKIEVLRAWGFRRIFSSDTRLCRREFAAQALSSVCEGVSPNNAW
jgi:hypothetical protein